MADIIKLGAQRKIRTRAEKEKAAQENRVKFGRTKFEKTRQKAKAEHTKSLLDGHKLSD